MKTVTKARKSSDPAVTKAVKKLLADPGIMGTVDQKTERVKLRLVHGALAEKGCSLNPAQASAAFRRYLQLCDPVPQRINLAWHGLEGERIVLGTDDNQVFLLDPSWSGEGGYDSLKFALGHAHRDHLASAQVAIAV